MNPFVKFGLVALIPVILSIIIYLLDKKTKFGKLKSPVKQAVIGVIFGGFAIFATEFGVDIGGAVANVRDAAPLCAGLIFGAPAGIIAGVIGAAERWFAVAWGAGTYTRLACTLATAFAGIIGAGCRKFMFNNKKPSWFYGLAIGMTTEVLHMLLIFLTRMSDATFAFTFVEKASLPMITANGISVMLSLLAVSLLGREKLQLPREKKEIAQTFQFALLVVVITAFCVTSLFTFSLQTRISNADTDNLLKLNMNDVKAAISDASDNNLLALTHKISASLSSESDSEVLVELMRENDVSEINIVDKNGIITASTDKRFIGFDMHSGEQATEFTVLLNGADEYVQEYRPTSYDDTSFRKYAGVALADGGFVQV